MDQRQHNILLGDWPGGEYIRPNSGQRRYVRRKHIDGTGADSTGEACMRWNQSILRLGKEVEMESKFR
jgi:hypothetical protein